jgi:CrcB protein
MSHSFDDLPVDPETPGPLAPRATLASLVAGRWDVLAVIAAGGAIGGGLRWLLNSALPHQPDQFPWSTFVENVSGCLAIGVLVTFVVEVWAPSRYVRPFWGVGVLGGYTTFSAYTTETTGLLREGASATALVYLFGSVAAGLLATVAGMWAARYVGRLLEEG